VKLSIVDLRQWESDPITKRFKEEILKLKENKQRQILDANILNTDNLGRKYARIIGFIEGIDTVLNEKLLAEDLENEEIQDSPSSGN
jgi:hypothetical protein